MTDDHKRSTNPSLDFARDRQSAIRPSTSLGTGNPQSSSPPSTGDVWAGEWLRLFRVPNLFTVVGDPLAGFVLAGAVASGGNVAAVVLAALCLYSAGLVLNDIFDIETDRVQRPHRPLPAGHIRLGAAITVVLVLLIAALALAFWTGLYPGIVACLIVVFVFLYDAWLKDVPVLGPLVMGSCRGLSLLLGASLTGADGLLAPAVVICAAGLLLYVASVTVIASHETEKRRLGFIRFLPLLTLLAWFLTFFLVAAPADNFALAASLFGAFVSLVWTYYCGQLLAGTPEPFVVSAAVGTCLRGLLIIQASLVATSVQPGLFIAAVLLLFLPISGYLSQRFAQS